MSSVVEAEKEGGEVVMRLHLGDCFEVLRTMDDNSVDAIVTDPPYGLSFMGKSWDYDVPGINIWEQCLRVLKPGGHLLAFFGTRTYHRGVIKIEDAGFEIRDQLQWIYGSGFPKSHDISKAIDKLHGAEREVIGKNPNNRPAKTKNGAGFDADKWGRGISGEAAVMSITAPATDDAKQWQGWGTALKPANEPIVVARKPLEKGLTVAQNVLKWGTGALNIDGSRIGYQSEADRKAAIPFGDMTKTKVYGGNSLLESKTVNDKTDRTHDKGRWPANVIFDEEAAEMLDGQSGNLKSGNLNGETVKAENKIYGKAGSTLNRKLIVRSGDSGGASRFFYVAKASKSERNAGLEGMLEKAPSDGRASGLSSGMPEKAMAKQANFHPTVKPVKLMQYLIKLVTPPNGAVLDPFMGSGTTGVAAKVLGFEFIGIERDSEYFKIAQARINNVKKESKDEPQLEFEAQS